MRDIFARKEINIGDGNIFYVQQYPPFEGLRVLGELQKVICPSLSGAVIGLKNDGFIGDGLAGGLMTLSENIDADKMEKLSKMLLNPQYVAVKIKGSKEVVALTEDVVNQIFTGRYFDMLYLMFKVAKENFLNFTQLTSVPTGLVTAVENLATNFAEKFQTSFNANISSTEPLTQE